MAINCQIMVWRSICATCEGIKFNINNISSLLCLFRSYSTFVSQENFGHQHLTFQQVKFSFCLPVKQTLRKNGVESIFLILSACHGLKRLKNRVVTADEK